MSNDISGLKNEILNILSSDEDKHFDVTILEQVILGQGYSHLEFIRAYNSLKMEMKINGNANEVWLHK